MKKVNTILIVAVAALALVTGFQAYRYFESYQTVELRKSVAEAKERDILDALKLLNEVEIEKYRLQYFQPLDFTEEIDKLNRRHSEIIDAAISIWDSSALAAFAREYRDRYTK